MNGRIYDPLVGRFLSPDPVLQFPNYTQGLNPYAYALNNPLRYVDPDGYSLVGDLLALSVQMGFTAMGMPWLGLALSSTIMTIDQQIESRGKINTLETFAKTFIIGSISMGATHIIGHGFDKLAAKGLKFIEAKRALAHGVFNGAMRMSQGGKFEHGFMSGFVSSLGGSFLQSHGSNMSVAEQVALSAAIGGTSEALGGGKFANGAVTGAYVMMFNHMGSQQQERARQELQATFFCIIPAGGISQQGEWRHTKSRGKFLFPVKAMSKVFRGIFTDGLIELAKQGSITLDHSFDENKKYLHPFYKERWVVFAKQPMLNAQQVLEYLGRYTHLIANSNHRIKDISNGKVRFPYIDYRHSKISEMELDACEFLSKTH